MKTTSLFCASVFLMGAASSFAVPVNLVNPGFEIQTPELTEGQSTPTLTPWQETGGPNAAAGLVEFLPGFASDGTDHLVMESGHDVWQDPGVTFLANTRYTLTLGVGNRSGQTVPGNASTALLASTGNLIFAKAVTDASTAAAPGTFAETATLVLDTIDEPRAVGSPMRVLLRARGAGRSFFDNIRLDATPVTANGRPTGTANGPVSITADGATVGGAITSIGSAAPSITIYYGLADAGSDPADWSFSKAIPGTFPAGNFSNVLSGLSSNTTWFYRLRFTNASGSTWASTLRTFKTVFAPSLTNIPVTNISAAAATAGGRVSGFSGNAPAVTLYYGTVDGGTVAANWEQSVLLGQTSGSITGNMTGLQPGTLYRYRAAASNPAGTGWAPESLSFSTLPVLLPDVVNRSASSIGLTTATLNAEVLNIGNEVPTVTFYYGKTDGGTDPAAWSGRAVVSLAAGKISTKLTGLEPQVNYFFRAAALNRAGTAWASDTGSFRTEAITLPLVRTLAATHVNRTGAVLNGEVTATGNEAPAVMIYWGGVDGGTVPAAWEHVATLGTSGGSFSRVLSDLVPGTTYVFRAFVSNSAGATWAANSMTFATPAADVPPAIVINEVHYDPLDPTRRQEFIELHNPGTTPVEITGWRLASAVDYTFGRVTIPAGGFFCVVQNPPTFATAWPAAVANSAGPWTGKLSNSGETIELRDAAGVLINAVDYGEGFPWPTASRGAGPSMELLHPALDNGLGASWRRCPATATPGAANGARLATASLAPPAIRGVSHLPNQPAANTPVSVTATVTDPDGVGSVVLRYQIVAPGSYIRKTDSAFSAAANWINLPMVDDGTAGDAAAGDSIFTAVIPASVQVHRRLIRYQINVTDRLNNTVRVPYADDEQPNFAYFVYNGVPGWSGALRPTAFAGFPATPVEDFPASLLQSIEPWHLIANEANIISCQYDSNFNGTLFLGTLVHRGQVYDHITYQVRGIGSVYVSGKNKWGIKFNRARDFQAYDNWGRPYHQKWNSLGLNCCASPWASVNRGAAGIEEAVSGRIYELGGVPALRSSYVHWRIIRRTAEVNPAASTITNDPIGPGLKGQYSGDLWGLYMAMEPTEGNFLDERGLDDGNIYSIEGDAGDKKHQADTQPAGTTDWDTFRNANVQAGQTEAWYRANNDLNALYTFMGLSRLIGNVDVRPGDNYRYYHRPSDNRWVVMPYDLDMMFIPAAHWGGAMDNGVIVAGAPNTIRAMSRWPAIALEYRNRCRELLSLMASDNTPNGGQVGQLIQEYARMVNSPSAKRSWADIDAAMWNLHPRTSGGGGNSGQSEHRGNFYRATYLDGTRGGLGGTAQTGSWVRSLPDPDNDKFSDHEGLAKWFTDFTTNTYPASAAAWVRKASNAGGSGTDPDVNRQKGYGWKALEWESIYGGFFDCNANPPATGNYSADLAYPNMPVIFASGSAGFPANDLRFTSTDFSDPQGSATAGAVQWRIGEISAPGIPGYDPAKPCIYELENVWTSAEIPLTSPAVAEVRIPAGAVVAGHTYRARVRHMDVTKRWSWWSPPVQFIVATANTAAYQSSLRITEINYNPGPVTPAEAAHPLWNPSWTSQQMEYIELTNISRTSTDLTDLRFTKGVDYDIPAGTQLAAGGRLIIARNPVAFAVRYGNGLPVAAGGFEPDALSNGGETLKLSFGAGTPVFEFSYGSSAPWPVAPNGTGSTLVLINPEKPGLNHGDPMEWRASLTSNGNPGSDDRISYTTWAAGYPGLGGMEEDPDGDGMTNLLEFSLGSSPVAASLAALPRASAAGSGFRFSFSYAPGNGGHSRHVEFSSDLEHWTENATLIGRTVLPDGRFNDTWQSALPLSPDNPRQYARLRVTVP